MKHLLVAAVLVLAGCAPVSAPGSGTVTVFAAASLAGPFDALALRFEDANPGVDVVMNYGGSAALATQIVAGAPADVFAAASTATMATVVDAGVAADPVDFATNVLELAVPAGNPGGVTGPADLADPGRVVVLCAVEVPCGAAAQAALDAAGVVPSVDSYEQDVKAVLTKVRLGEADAGLVYASDVLAAGGAVESIPFPEAERTVTRYPIVALTDTDLADAFVRFVLSPEGGTVLREAGFRAP